jgi:hypothetical protein
MILRKISGSLVMTSFGPTRIREPVSLVSSALEGYRGDRTVLVVGFHERIRLSSPKRLTDHP